MYCSWRRIFNTLACQGFLLIRYFKGLETVFKNKHHLVWFKTLEEAIDLIDEAASKLRMEIDSKPAELDEIDRKIMQLEIEREALKKEKDEASKERLDRLEKEIGADSVAEE